ncbi:lanthionine synthetase LanC family protein [Aquimarina rhabdastrellae]
MASPTFNNDLGIVIYFASRYKHSKDNSLKEKAITLLDKFIEQFGEYDFHKGILTGFEGVFWSIAYLEECGIIENADDYLSDLEQELITSIIYDIKSDNFELYYGFTGKLQYFLNSKHLSNETIVTLINSAIASLWNSKIEHEGQFYWLDPERKEEQEIVDLGIAHGIVGVLTFLTRLKELNFKNDHISPLLSGILKTILNATHTTKGDCAFPSIYSIKKENQYLNVFDSRLGFCNGDLPIAYGLYYYGVTFKDDFIIKKAQKVTDRIICRDITNSSLLHLADHDFFDIGFCHGISSICFILSRISQWYKQQPILTTRLQYWNNELHRNTLKVIDTNKPVTYYSRFVKHDSKFKLDTTSFLEGVTSTGLVNLAIENNDYSIGNFLGLY